MRFIFMLFTLLWVMGDWLCSAQVLTPKYFNLALGRKVEATSTCGVGVVGPELFCKLTSANKDRFEDMVGDLEIIEGHLCDHCDPRNPSMTHPAEMAVDGSERWWQSPPLSRGLQYNQVNFTVHLEQLFHVAYVFIKMANSPRPGVFALERSTDNGRTWKAWQYFADTPSDCENFFGREGYSERITRDDSVICTTAYSSIVPLEGGEIVVSLVNNRPSSDRFAHSQTLQDWTKATDVRLRLLRTNTLLGHLMAVAREDPTVTRRYYYSIKDISIGGNCVCHGHASTCDKTDPHRPDRLVCQCEHNTCGEHCEKCCPGFVQKPWRPAIGDQINACEPCQCHGHARECRYDPEVDRMRGSIDIHGNREGGGVCIDCQHFTTGVNCERCLPGYYRPHGVPIEAPNACQPCRCDPRTTIGDCEEGTGRCRCKPGIEGPDCSRCAPGHYRFPECSRCECHEAGVANGACDRPGQACPCKPNFTGPTCAECAPGYYGFPECRRCQCNPQTTTGSCEPRTGQCRCREGFNGPNCDRCQQGYYGFPNCQRCRCYVQGCTGEVCSPDGRCICKEGFTGPMCDRCAQGYFNFPQCTPCRCHGPGVASSECDQAGNCRCRPGFGGRECNQCAPGYVGYPNCRECRYNPQSSYGCNEISGELRCREGFGGSGCDSCEQGYFGYPNCQQCRCNTGGTTREVCSKDGRCICKEGFTGPMCDRCDQGYFNFPECIRCRCSSQGSVSTECDQTGSCRCRPGYAGRECNQCDVGFSGYPNCRECNCNQKGADSCDPRTGRCICKPNVVGPNCDQCAPGTYGFEGGRGCQPCACGPGAVSQSCDARTGKCPCAPGVGGDKCDRCEEGYWNFNPRGCQKCPCPGQGSSCDQRTGRCTCKPGHTGPNCEQCLENWIMVPGAGCQDCDECIEILLGDISNIDALLLKLRRDLEGDSAANEGRLALINRTAHELRIQVDLRRKTDGGSAGGATLDEANRLKDMALNLVTKTQRTIRHSEDVQTSATVTKLNAESLYEEILIKITREVKDTVAYVNDALRNLTIGIGPVNIDEMIREAERMLREIRIRDFTRNEISVTEELKKAIDALRRANELMDKASGQINRTTLLSIELESVLEKLRELQNFSRLTSDKSDSTSRLNLNLNQIKIKVTETVERITKIREEIRGCIDKSRDMLDKARQYIRDARIAYLDAERELSRLDRAKIRLQVFIEDLTKQNIELMPLVFNATEHALKLKREAEYLESLIVDIRLASERAYNASRAYQDIIDAINSALNASLAAIDASEKAIQLSTGHAEDAKKSRERSRALKEEADKIVKQVELELRIRLTNVKRTIEEWTKTNIRISETVKDIVLGLDMLPEGGYGEQAREAADKAMDAQRKAEDAESKVTIIIDRLVEDKIRLEQIPKDIEEANRNAKQAQIQVEEVVKLVPTAIDLLNRLSIHAVRIRELGVTLRNNITILRDEIHVARTVANLIRVGINYNEDTSLQVRNPENLITSGAFSRVSLYFRTNQPDGLLFYIGPDTGPQMIDYMALEIVGGKVVFKFDLGGGPVEIVNNKNVADGEWHQVTAERVGNHGTLIVRTMDEDEVVATGESSPSHTILNLNADTKFYVGGIPNRSALLGILSRTRFRGCLEQVTFNGITVGLWNFVYADRTRGCEARDKLLTGFDNGFMFNGNGYLILRKDRFKPDTSSQVKFSFRSLARDGLMFLIGSSPHHYMSVELRDGQVLFQFDLGSGRAVLLSPQNYNDGEWHTVLASRSDQDGILKIDGLTVASARSPGNLKDLDMDNYIYIGGFKGTHKYPHVTQKGFEGCIKDLQLGTTVRNVYENVEVKDVYPGCRETSHLVSFRHEIQDSYIALPSQNVGSKFDASFKIKTTEQDGLLFYLTDGSTDQQNAFSVSVVGGKIMLIHVIDGRRTVEESSQSSYSDGRWHFINIQKEGRNILMQIDDSETVVMTAAGATLQTSSLLYLGGIPPSYTIVMENVGTRTHLVGCIGDVIVNRELLDFAKVPASNQLGAIIGSCHVLDPTPPPRLIVIPTLPPIPPTGDALTREKCALPLVPNLSVDDKGEEGTQFGLRSDSRQEYRSLPSAGDITTRSEFSVEFKTLSAQGIMYYMSNDRHVDFVTLYINNGQVTFAFNCGSGTGKVTTKRLYNDGKWHKVIFSRDQNEGTLNVDGFENLPFQSGGRSRTLEVDAPYYVGGLPPRVATAAAGNIEGLSAGFVGCLRNLQVNGQDFGQPTESIKTQSCSKAIEPGSFFHAAGGYLRLYNNYTVPLDLDISLMIKPRRLSGVIFSVYHKLGLGLPGDDYLVMQMVNGDLIFSMDNGDGDVSATYKPPARNDLCDGEWHLVRAQKAKNVVTLEVDNILSPPGIAGPGIATTNTEDPLFIGGVPERHRGIRTTETYAGCIRDLYLADKLQDLSTAQKFGEVDVGSCPTQ